MRILFCSSPSVAFMGQCGGVRKLMLLYEEALKGAGHEVEYLPSHSPPRWEAYDVCHLFMANGESFGIGVEACRHLPLVVSPIIDKLFAHILMRVNVLLDKCLPVIYTHLGKCATLCRMANGLCLMSSHERRLATHGLGVSTPATVVLAAVSPEINEPQPGRFAEYTGKPYILFLGDAGNPRKNVAHLIEAVRGLEIDLLIGGTITQTRRGDKVRKMAEDSANVRIVGFVSEGEKAFLFRHARAFVLPSLMEGIGLVAVEAALAGATVVITKSGGPPDYFGNYAYYVSPRSVNDIRNKIRKALISPRDASSQIQQICTLEATAKSLETCYHNSIRSKSA